MPAVILATVVGIFIVTALCYWPSITGPFIFDDTPNLQELGRHGRIDSVDKFIDFVTSGRSGPLGRPLSLASFALNGQDWPTDPLPFRLTNLFIHFTNGLLVFLLAQSLLSTVHSRDTALKLGLACMALWVLHPLQVSTAAYVIQRMTELASMFVLAGLLCFVHGRKQLAISPRAGWLWILCGMAVNGLLAVLSKETGALLPLFALIIELTVFRAIPLPQSHKRSLIALLSAPLLLMTGYFIFFWDILQKGFDYRPFSLNERLLTQPVVLVEYLKQIFAPNMSGLGIIHDDFPVSTSLFDPPWTLFSLLLITTLLVVAIWCRKGYPIVAMGILWFFVGHSLEAGPLSLELYFDHRNYLPLFGPVVAVISLAPRLPAKLRHFTPVLLGLFLCFSAFLTFQSAKLWGDERLMMQVALIDHPTSLRARQYIANQHILAGEYRKALNIQRQIEQNLPEHTSTRLSILNLQCRIGNLTPEQVDATQRYLRHGAYDQQIIGFFMPLLSIASKEQCSAFGMDEFQHALDAVLENPALSKDGRTRAAAHYFKGLGYEKAGQLDAAIQQLDLSYDVIPELDIRLQQVVWLLNSKQPDDAEHYLELTREHRDRHSWAGNLRESDLLLLQQQIDQLRRNGI